MRFLHTADWHVGRTLRGVSRAAEHRAVLSEMAAIARDRRVDAVLVAGDLFESAAPPPEAEEIVYRALLDLAAVAPVFVIAGNHDHPARLHAVKPLLAHGRVTLLARVARAEAGGAVELRTAHGERARLVLLPFVPQRDIVRADALMAADAGEHAGEYRERLARIIAALCAGALPASEGVNVLLGHAAALGGMLGGGERAAHTVFQYQVATAAFPRAFHYVALGHLHRAQQLAGPCPVHYSGSPLQLDFGETNDCKSVNVVEAVAGRPAEVEVVPLAAGRRLRRIAGTPEALWLLAGTTGDAFLQVDVDAPPTPGLADRVREAFPHAVDVRLKASALRDGAAGSRKPEPGRSPQQLFADYLAAHGGPNEAVEALFAALLDEAHAS
jgi:exonuclease SbcD